MNTKVATKNLGLATAFDAVDALVKRDNIPDNTFPAQQTTATASRPSPQTKPQETKTSVTPLRQDKSTEKEKRKSSAAPTVRLSVDMPNYLHRDLKKDAADEGCSTKNIIMLALKEYGYTIREADLQEDGRGARK